MGRWLVILVAVVAVCCSGVEVRRQSEFYDMDSLINAQVYVLSHHHSKLNKRATVGDRTTSVSLAPDSAGWAYELEVFRQLQIAGRPTYRDRYRIEESSDPKSNLRIQSFVVEEKWLEDTPVPYVRIYYLDDPADVRRIVCAYKENNALYRSERTLTMRFEGGTAQPLSHYNVEGFQKLLIGDSIRFSIEGEVIE
jgi:hypothetical protein